MCWSHPPRGGRCGSEGGAVITLSWCLKKLEWSLVGKLLRDPTRERLLVSPLQTEKLSFRTKIFMGTRRGRPSREGSTGTMLSILIKGLQTELPKHRDGDTHRASSST